MNGTMHSILAQCMRNMQQASVSPPTTNAGNHLLQANLTRLLAQSLAQQAASNNNNNVEGYLQHFTI